MSDNIAKDALTFTVLADIRAILGVGMRPMLEELPDLIRDLKDRADAAPAPLALTTRQVKGLRAAYSEISEDMPSEEQCSKACEILRTQFPAAFAGEWWRDA